MNEMPRPNVSIPYDQYQALLLLAAGNAVNEEKVGADSAKGMIFTWVEEGRSTTTYMIDFINDANKQADSFGNTWLHVAAETGNELMMSGFLRMGKNVELDVRNNAGFTPLMVAVEAGRGKVVDVLLAGGADMYAIYHFHDRDKEKNVQSYGNKLRKDGRNAYHLSVDIKSIPLTKAFLDNGMDPMIPVQSNSYFSAVHIASSNGDLTMLQLLFSYGAKLTTVDTVDGKKCNPPLSCCRTSSMTPEVAQFLIDQGDNPRMIFEDGSTLLHTANPEVSQLLLSKYQLDPNRTNQKGLTALHSKFSQSAFHVTPAEVECFCKHGFEVDSQSPEGKTLLVLALERVEWKKVRCMHILLDYGANPNQECEKGRKILSRIFDLYHQYLGEQKLENKAVVELVKKFLSKGAKIDYSVFSSFRKVEHLFDREFTQLIHSANSKDSECILF